MRRPLQMRTHWRGHILPSTADLLSSHKAGYESSHCTQHQVFSGRSDENARFRVGVLGVQFPRSIVFLPNCLEQYLSYCQIARRLPLFKVPQLFSGPLAITHHSAPRVSLPISLRLAFLLLTLPCLKSNSFSVVIRIVLFTF